MDEKFRCEECDREFHSEDSLAHHNRDKHGVGGTQSRHELKQLKKQEREKHEDLDKKRAARSKLIKRSAYISVPILLIVAVSIFAASQPQATGSAADAAVAADIPKTPIHWHPALEVVIKGQKQTIPANLGAAGVHQPIHTHDTTGVLHYENSNPTPENMPLRYFFDNVWKKEFNSTCILNYCSGDSGTVKMFVNGKENFEFDDYIPRDKDEIRIEFN